MDRRKLTLAGAATGVAAGLVGLVVLAMPASAGPAPSLPPTTPEQLVTSVLTAKPPAASGTVEIHNALGLPVLPIPNLPPAAANGTSQVRVWSDGNGRSRISLPSRASEQTIVNDGTTTWQWDSATHTVTKSAHAADPNAPQAPATMDKTRPTDPASMAQQLVSQVRDTSTASVDGTATVAGRSVYQLVLTPKPAARTLLREIRVAVDSQLHVPVQLQVFANGSATPALQVGFTTLTVGAPDPAMFTFTPPAGATVKVPQNSNQTPNDAAAQVKPTVIGKGWDTVVIANMPPATPGASSGKGHSAAQDPLSMVKKIGAPVNGPWGNGWVLTSKVGTVLVTADGRITAGAVPQQVLTDALTSVK